MENARMGFEGVLNGVQLKKGRFSLRVGWRGTEVTLNAPAERFPHLANAYEGLRVRVLGCWLRGLRRRPDAVVGDLTEIFLVHSQQRA